MCRVCWVNSTIEVSHNLKAGLGKDGVWWTTAAIDRVDLDEFTQNYSCKVAIITGKGQHDRGDRHRSRCDADEPAE